MTVNEGFEKSSKAAWRTIISGILEVGLPSREATAAQQENASTDNTRLTLKCPLPLWFSRKDTWDIKAAQSMSAQLN